MDSKNSSDQTPLETSIEGIQGSAHPQSSVEGASQSGEPLIQVQATPNPRAKIFWISRPICLGSSVNITRDEAPSWGVRLVTDLFLIPEVVQVHLRENALTVTLDQSNMWDQLTSEIVAIIKTRLPVHDPMFWQKKVKPRQAPASAEVAAVENLLDQHIRPYLRLDGGDLEVLEVKDHQVFVRYQGACGHCPSSYQGTLQAIEGMLRQHWRSDAEVIPVD